MKRTMNFTLDVPSEILREFAGRHDLHMILWAGDTVHNNITDIERLPDFDVYVCFGFSQEIGLNIDYIYNRSRPGIICIIDVTNKEHMAQFVKVFHGRFSVIDSDYHGNTPTLPCEYYDALLSNEGKAFNMRGINSCILPVEDFQNCMELFAPVLSHEDNHLRTWTSEIVDIARADGLSPSAVWTSPDFNGVYYDGVKLRQEELMKWNKDRNPVFTEIDRYSMDTIEEYWKRLPLHILTVNFERTNILNESFRKYATICHERFRSFIIEEILSMIKTPDEFREHSKSMSIRQIQEHYRLCKEYPNIEFGFMKDNRNGKNIYGHWIKKNNAL